MHRSVSLSEPASPAPTAAERPRAGLAGNTCGLVSVPCERAPPSVTEGRVPGQLRCPSCELQWLEEEPAPPFHGPAAPRGRKPSVLPGTPLPALSAPSLQPLPHRPEMARSAEQDR